MENTNYYVASFETDQGKTLRLRIGRGRPGVSPSEARAALADIVAANALDPEFGVLTGAKGLQFVSVQKTPFSVA